MVNVNEGTAYYHNLLLDDLMQWQQQTLTLLNWRVSRTICLRWKSNETVSKNKKIKKAVVGGSRTLGVFVVRRYIISCRT